MTNKTVLPVPRVAEMLPHKSMRVVVVAVGDVDPRREGSYASCRVLCVRQGYEPYVVWTYVMPDNGEPSYCISGFYTNDLSAALATFSD